jgi:catechol 2,3-dioxygenase-like lactoylglutathione lyase family enzyme
MIPSTRLHHIALGTRDVEATYDFYANRLGLPLVHCENHLHQGGWVRHFFFAIGNEEYIGFFAFENVGEKPNYRTDISKGLGLPVWVNHVAFNVESMADLERTKRRCEAHGVPLVMETDHGWCHSIYLMDPNGIMVEFTTNTRPERFAQTPDEALRLLRQPPAEFDESRRKDETYDGTPVHA